MTTKPNNPDASSGLSSSGSRNALAEGVSVDSSALQYSFARSSGPGGQAVNKLNTRAELRVAISAIDGLNIAAGNRLRMLAGRRLNKADEIVLRSQASRSQYDNKQTCLDRLRGLVQEAAVPPKRRKKVKPTRAMIRKRQETKRRISEKKKRRRGRKAHSDDL